MLLLYNEHGLMLSFFNRHALIGYSLFVFFLEKTKRNVENSFLHRHGINVIATFKGCVDKGTRQRTTNTYNMCNECTYNVQLPPR